MKRILVILFVAIMSSTLCSAAMSNSKIRKETRFLTDKMAYEMQLSTEQYNDVYEINYDFIANVGSLMDNVLRGDEWALNRYYDCLDVRNDDLRWVLSSRQYSRFMQVAYFFRPIYVNGGRWSFRVYITYTNPRQFYFPVPYHYRTYRGGHYRSEYHNASYYRGRHNQPTYNGNSRIRDEKSYHTSRRSDFGSITIRPNSSSRPTVNEPGRRSSANQSERRSEKPNESTSPKRESGRRSEGVRRSSGSNNVQIDEKTNNSSRRSGGSSSNFRSSSRFSEKGEGVRRNR